MLCTVASTLHKLLHKVVGREVHIARGEPECYVIVSTPQAGLYGV